MAPRNLPYEAVLDMTSWTAHVCPVSEVPNAARTITSVLNAEGNPTVRFISGLPVGSTLVQPGKTEEVSVYLYRTLTSGLVLTVDDGDEKCVGVAVWKGPVAQPTTFWGKARDFLAYRAVDVYQSYNWVFYGDAGKAKATRLEALDRAAQAIWKESLGEGGEKENWYLHMLAVRPEYQGKGIAKTLVKYVTDSSDRDGRKCYLITSLLEPNVAIYERLGFKVVGNPVVRTEGDEVKIWCMVREPRRD